MNSIGHFSFGLLIASLLSVVGDLPKEYGLLVGLLFGLLAMLPDVDGPLGINH